MSNSNTEIGAIISLSFYNITEMKKISFEKLLKHHSTYLPGLKTLRLYALFFVGLNILKPEKREIYMQVGRKQ